MVIGIKKQEATRISSKEFNGHDDDYEASNIWWRREAKQQRVCRFIFYIYKLITLSYIGVAIQIIE